VRDQAIMANPIAQAQALQQQTQTNCMLNQLPEEQRAQIEQGVSIYRAQLLNQGYDTDLVQGCVWTYYTQSCRRCSRTSSKRIGRVGSSSHLNNHLRLLLHKILRCIHCTTKRQTRYNMVSIKSSMAWCAHLNSCRLCNWPSGSSSSSSSSRCPSSRIASLLRTATSRNNSYKPVCLATRWEDSLWE